MWSRRSLYLSQRVQTRFTILNGHQGWSMATYSGQLLTRITTGPVPSSASRSGRRLSPADSAVRCEPMLSGLVLASTGSCGWWDIAQAAAWLATLPAYPRPQYSGAKR